MTGAAADDCLGTSVALAADVDGDGTVDIVVGAPYATNTAGSESGSVYVLHGPVSGVVDASAADLQIDGVSSDYRFGSALAVGDVDADGYTDLWVGATHAALGMYKGGGAFLVHGPATSGTTAISSMQRFGTANGDVAGSSVAVVGDVDGDGIGDLLVGAPNVSGSLSASGAAYLVLGSSTGVDSLSGSYAIFYGRSAGAHAGSALSGAGDVNGDGMPDIVIGAADQNISTHNEGVAYLIYGPFSGSSSLGAADAAMAGETDSDHAGEAVAGVGDTNGDGYDDLAIGVPYQDGGGDSAGGVAIFAGPLSGMGALSSADGWIEGSGGNGRFGASISAVGDLDGDGFHDLLVGAYRVDLSGRDRGSAYVFFGPFTANETAMDADKWLGGVSDRDYAGSSISGGGDIDGDGIGDLLIGANGDGSGGRRAGAAYLVLGDW